MSNDLAFKSLGLCDYQETLDAMRSHLGSEQFHDEIWFVEHPPVFTLGTAADKSHILNAKIYPSFKLTGVVRLLTMGQAS